MINLFGVYESTVDAKGRVMLPSPYRKTLSFRRRFYHQAECIQKITGVFSASDME